MERKPTLVVALGGNALLKRGEPLEAEIQRQNIEQAARTIAGLTAQWRVVLVHGNGPQVGLLALQNSAYDKVTPYPLDVLGAESQGMIGYMLQQALKNSLPQREVSVLLTQVEVDAADPAFSNPTKYIGPVYSEAQAKALAAEKAVTPRTVNLELAYFRAMFNELKRLDDWSAPNPLENVREFKIDEAELAWLTVEEVKQLLAECEKSKAVDLVTIVKICLATGARWGEAESLTGKQISPGKITYIKTKGKKNRAVPISDELYEILPKVRTSKPVFTGCYSAFRGAIKRAGIELPDGQLSHVLRHTFASHFMMRGGNILVLQRILGHTDIKVTMRYAHFAPDHLTEAVELNPLNLI